MAGTGGMVRVAAVAVVALVAACDAFWLFDTPRVKLRQGVIQGVKISGPGGSHFYAFKGIPFARPPVGDLRFKSPVVAGGWAGMRDGSQTPPVCPQILLSSLVTGQHEVVGQEDCLYLNVFKPLSGRGKAVMVWIHGGGFTWGSGGPVPHLPADDVVVVTLQYRLNTLGFLSTGDGSIPGNLGLRDQVAALRWVRDNIRHFGGDPAKVTIFGESAGAAAVHYLVLSPMAQGLFQRAIMQSGTSLANWALWRRPVEVAARLGGLMGCPGVGSQYLDTQALLVCLRNKPFQDLVLAQRNYTVWLVQSTSVMIPSVDGEFLPDEPEILLREGRYNKVDIISGVTRDEGSYATSLFFGNPQLLTLVNENLPTLAPLALNFHAWNADPGNLTVATMMHYLGSLELSQDKFHHVVRLITDGMFKISHLDTLEHHLRDRNVGKKVYAYEFQHRGEVTFLELVTGRTQGFPYVGHADDLFYQFNLEELSFQFPRYNYTLSRPEDLFVSSFMSKLWTNFAKTGDPTPDLSLGFSWHDVSPSDLSVLAINTSPAMMRWDTTQLTQFWRKLPTYQNELLYPARTAGN